MSSTMTSSERLTQLDEKVEHLQRAFIEAAQQLDDAPEVDSSFDALRWASIARRLRELRPEPADFDKDQLSQLSLTLFEIRDVLDERPQDLDAIDQLLVALERVRHVVRDALDEHVAGFTGDVGLVTDQLRDTLAKTKLDDIAELVGVNRRTLTRWTKQSGPPPRRLKTVARVVAILRHNWTEDGIVAWFYRPRRDLEGQAPIAVLSNDKHDDERLVSAARAGRSMYAS